MESKKISHGGKMKKILIALMFLSVNVSAEGFFSVPGFDYIIDRAKNHGYVGRAWDLNGRPYGIYTLTMNNKGPVYFSIGAQEGDSWKPLGGIQYDALDLWRRSRLWPLISKMELVKFPKQWRFLVGPQFNFFTERPDKMRIDRELLFSATLHIPLGGK